MDRASASRRAAFGTRDPANQSSQPNRAAPAPSRERPTSPDAVKELSLAALTIALIFGVALILPMPFWRSQPVAPPPPGVPAACDLGWPAGILAIVFALALCVPFRPYVLALRAACG